MRVKSAQQQQQIQCQSPITFNAPSRSMDQVSGCMHGVGITASPESLYGHLNVCSRALVQLTEITNPARLNELIQHSLQHSETLRQRGEDPSTIDLSRIIGRCSSRSTLRFRVLWRVSGAVRSRRRGLFCVWPRVPCGRSFS